MNILGIGLDATDIPRVADVFERYGERFLQRVFTDGEIAYCTGGGTRPAPGRPFCRERSRDEGARHRSLARRALEGHRSRARRRATAAAAARRRRRRADGMQVRRSLLTITHSDTLAMAQVMLIGD